MDADGWRKMMLSKSFGESPNDFCSALANVTKQICTEKCTFIRLQGLLECWLIPLIKNPGLKPIGIGEILRIIIGKVAVQQ